MRHLTEKKQKVIMYRWPDVLKMGHSKAFSHIWNVIFQQLFSSPIITVYALIAISALIRGQVANIWF